MPKPQKILKFGMMGRRKVLSAKAKLRELDRKSKAVCVLANMANITSTLPLVLVLAPRKALIKKRLQSLVGQEVVVRNVLLRDVLKEALSIIVQMNAHREAALLVDNVLKVVHRVARKDLPVATTEREEIGDANKTYHTHHWWRAIR
jgi:hypothetical protein